MRFIVASLSLCFLSGCARERPPAPDDLDGMSHFLFVNWNDDKQMSAGMSVLGPWLETEGRTEESTSFGFLLTDLTSEETIETPHPEYDLDLLIGVALTGISPFPIEEHGALITRKDQTWNSPKTYIKYDRTLIEGSVEEFVGPLGRVRTENDIDKSGPLGIHIPYFLNKDFKWVETDTGKPAIVARSWVEAEGCSGSDGQGKNCVSLSFSIDLWYASEANETIRLTSTWNHLQTSVDDLLTEEFLVKTMTDGLQDVFENTDAVLNDEL